MKQRNISTMEIPAAARGYTTEERQRFLESFGRADRLLLFASNPLLHIFIRHVSRMVQVIAICSRKEDNVIHVWTIIEAPDKVLENQIYAEEMKLMEHFPDILFDFHVIYLSGTDLSVVLPTDSEIVYMRD